MLTLTRAYRHTQTNKQFNYVSNSREGGVQTICNCYLAHCCCLARCCLARCYLAHCCLVQCNAVLVITDFVGAAGVLGQYLSGKQLPNENVDANESFQKVSTGLTPAQWKLNGNVTETLTET